MALGSAFLIVWLTVVTVFELPNIPWDPQNDFLC